MKFLGLGFDGSPSVRNLTIFFQLDLIPCFCGSGLLSHGTECKFTSSRAGFILDENQAKPYVLGLIFIFSEKIKQIWDEIETL